MSIFLAFALVTLGMVVHAVHTYICRNAIIKAWNAGYDQRNKESIIRNAAEETTEKRMKAIPASMTYMVDASAFAGCTAEKQPQKQTAISMQPPQPIPETFAQQLQRNGRAAARRTGGTWNV